MPYAITWEPDGVYRRYVGRVTIDEPRRSFDEIGADPRFDDLRYTITDYLCVDDYEITSEGAWEIAALQIGSLLTNPGIMMAADCAKYVAGPPWSNAGGRTGVPRTCRTV